MTIFDAKVPVHETSEGIESMNSLVHQLAFMLCQFNVKHSFALATDKEMDEVEAQTGKKLLYWLFYEQEQNTELTLAIALFSKVFLKKDDSKILACIVKSMTKAINEIV